MVSNKEMTFLERLYLVAIVKGLFITIKHLFSRKVTVQYPEQVRTMSPVYRGQHMLKRDEQGRDDLAAMRERRPDRPIAAEGRRPPEGAPARNAP